MAPHRRWIEARAKVVNEGRCRNCGTTLGLQAAHLIPRSRINAGAGAEDPRNIIPLCGPFQNACHESYDHHRLAIADLITAEEHAYMVFLVGEGETERRIQGGSRGDDHDHHRRL